MLFQGDSDNLLFTDNSINKIDNITLTKIESCQQLSPVTF